MRTDEVCPYPVRHVCSPGRSLIGWLPFVSCTKLMISDAIVIWPVSQGVVSVARRWFFNGFAVRLSSRVWVSASRLAFVGHLWSLPSPFMVVSLLLVGRSCSHLLVESLRTCWIVGGRRCWFSLEVRRLQFCIRNRVARQTHCPR